MVDKIPTKVEILDMVDAQGGTIDDISKRLGKLEEKLEKQDSKNQNVIIGTLIALVLIVGTVAVEVIISNKNDSQFYSGLQRDVHDQDLKVHDLSTKIETMRIKNYLK